MAKVGATRAAQLTGKSKSTIQRAMDAGKLSFEKDANNRRVIDVSELERVYGLAQPEQEQQQNAESQAQVGALDVESIIEMERYKLKVEVLEDQLDAIRTQLDDMRGQRDEWQKQAQQVLITSQYSQKQAEELKEKIRLRDKREKAKRDQLMQQRMQKLQTQQANASKQVDTSSVGSAQNSTQDGQTAARPPMPLQRRSAPQFPPAPVRTEVQQARNNHGNGAQKAVSPTRQSSSRPPYTGKQMSNQHMADKQSAARRGPPILQPANESIWKKIKKSISTN